MGITFRLNIDSVGLTEKPKEVGAIRNRLCRADAIQTVTPDLFVKAIEAGRAFTPAAMTGTSGNSWQSQQVLGADIDNANPDKSMIDNPMSPVDAYEILMEYGIDPAIMYETFSHTEEYPKFRVLVILDQPITDPNEAQDLRQRFIGIFNHGKKGCADTKVADAARLFYPGRPDCVFHQGGITPLDVIRNLPLPPVDVDTVTPTETTGKKETDSNKYNGTDYGMLLDQFEHDKATFDLAAYVEQTTSSRPKKKGKEVFFNPCPICGHRDCFNVSGNVWKCWSDNHIGIASGTVIDYLMAVEKIDRGQALDKFKFDIMRYDREQWRKAWIMSQQQKAGNETFDWTGEINDTDDTPAEIATATTTDGDPQQTPPEQPTEVRKSPFVSAATYIDDGTYDDDIAYFQKYKDRKTGFSQIDEYLTLYPGLAVLGGVSSLGKTTFCVNLVDKLLARGETVLYFSLEQLPIELITKSVARIVKENNPNTSITNLDIKNGMHDPEITRARREYAGLAKKLFYIAADFRYTAGMISEIVQKFIKENNGVRPVIVLDYLQLLAYPANHRGSIREAVDENLKTLKDMQKCNELFVIVISSFNRSSNLEPLSYESFKETGMIEFTCDFVFGLQLSIQNENSFYRTWDEQKKRQRETTLDEKRDMIRAAQERPIKEVDFIALKNRNGKQRFNVSFNYYMENDLYVEDSSETISNYKQNPSSQQAFNGRTDIVI